MNEKEVLIRIIDAKNNYMIRAEYTSIPSEMLKMYHYMKNKDGLYIHIDEDSDKSDSKYNDIECTVTDINITPGGDSWINCINVYVEVI